jgi:hypothetical protein
LKKGKKKKWAKNIYIDTYRHQYRVSVTETTKNGENGKKGEKGREKGLL